MSKNTLIVVLIVAVVLLLGVLVGMMFIQGSSDAARLPASALAQTRDTTAQIREIGETQDANYISIMLRRTASVSSPKEQSTFNAAFTQVVDTYTTWTANPPDKRATTDVTLTQISQTVQAKMASVDTTPTNSK